jgi:hypothetical protein
VPDTTTPIDYSEREHAALQRYAQERGLTVEQVTRELAQSEIARRIGPSMQIDARVIPFRRVR